MIGKEEGSLTVTITSPDIAARVPVYAKVFFVAGPLHSDWIREFYLSRSEHGVTVRSEDGKRRTFYPWHIVESIEYEEREA